MVFGGGMKEICSRRELMKLSAICREFSCCRLFRGTMKR